MFCRNKLPALKGVRLSICIDQPIPTASIWLSPRFSYSRRRRELRATNGNLYEVIAGDFGNMYQRIIQTACFHFIVVGFASLTMGQAPLHSQESGTDTSWLRSTSPAAYKILPRPTHHATVPATQQPTLRVRQCSPMPMVGLERKLRLNGRGTSVSNRPTPSGHASSSRALRT